MTHAPLPQVATITKSDSWLPDPAILAGSWQGAGHGAAISIIANVIDAPGGGVGLHQHPYAEIFVVRAGHVAFTVGTARYDAGPGDIVVAPPDTPHAFVNAGPGALEMLDIHQHRTFDTTWLTAAEPRH